MTWVASAALAIAAIGTGTEMYESHEAQEAQGKALENKQLQNQYSSLLRKNQTMDAMDRQLQSNEAHYAASGVQDNSPSVFAANMNTVQEGHRAIHNSDVAESLNNYSIEMEKQQSQQQETGAMIEGGLSIAGDAAYGAYKYKQPPPSRTSPFVSAYGYSGSDMYMSQV
jgi:hypothetical protein